MLLRKLWRQSSLLVSIGFLGLVGTAPAVFLSQVASAQCRPGCPYKDGWLGGDSAYSIPLPDGRSLWLFGDSLVGKPSQRKRAGTKFVSNSIGISSCDQQNRWAIRYYWRNQYRANPKPVFDSGTDKYKYWVQDGFAYRKSVYISLARVRDRPDIKIFPFEYIGADLARISNPSDPPEKWRIEYFPLVEGLKTYPGATIVSEGEYVYLFSLFDDVQHERRPMLLTRVPLQGLDHPAASLEYLGKDKEWKQGLKPEDALPVIEMGHSEMTIRYHSNVRTWVAVMIDTEHFLSNKIVIATAPELSGPWSRWQAAYEIPDAVPTSVGYDKDTFCYAAKEHIEFATENTLLITYACNSFKLGKMLANMAIYLPRVVELSIPPQANHSP